MITLLNKFDDGYVIRKKDVLDIIDNYTKKDDLDYYIRDVSFDNTSKYAGSYNIGSRKITLNEEMLLKNCNEMFDELSGIYKINDDYRSYFVNFYYLYTLFHEIEHANQEKNYCLMNKNVLYEVLYELGLRLKDNNQEFYHENHSLFPMEIDANNTGYLRAYNLLSYTKLPKRETMILYLQYLFSLLCNYQRVSNNYILTPIEKLLESNNNDIHMIIRLLKETNLSKIERMNFGLFITPKEFDSVERQKRKILCHRGVLLK